MIERWIWNTNLEYELGIWIWNMKYNNLSTNKNRRDKFWTNNTIKRRDESLQEFILYKNGVCGVVCGGDLPWIYLFYLFYFI